MSPSENMEQKLFEELIDSTSKSLAEIRNALWIYDFEKACAITRRTLEEVNEGLRRIGLDVETLINEARAMKRKIEEGRAIEIPGHEITILAPILARLTKLCGEAQQLAQMQREGMLKLLRPIKQCVILSLGNVYLARCLLSKPLKIEQRRIEDLLKQLFNPTDLEINVLDEIVEARVWLQNMVMDITIVGEKLEIRILAPPKIRAKPEIIKEIVMRIFVDFETSNVSSRL